MPKALKKRDAFRAALGNQWLNGRCVCEEPSRIVHVHRTRNGRGTIGRLVDREESKQRARSTAVSASVS